MMKKYLLPLIIFNTFLCFSQEQQELNLEIRETIEEIKEFVAIPNDALYIEDIRKNINWFETKF